MDRRGRGLRRDPATEVAQRLFFRLHFFFFFAEAGRFVRFLHFDFVGGDGWTGAAKPAPLRAETANR